MNSQTHQVAPAHVTDPRPLSYPQLVRAIGALPASLRAGMYSAIHRGDFVALQDTADALAQTDPALGWTLFELVNNFEYALLLGILGAVPAEVRMARVA